MPESSRSGRRWWVLATLVLCLVVVVLDNTILNVALKTVQLDLGATQSQLAWTINAYTLVFAGLLFTYGVLGDRFGRRRVLVLGLTVFAAASSLCAYARTPEQLIAARALMGLGGAAVMPSTLSIISDVFDPAERGRAIGIWAGFTGIAIALGPITGGLLLARFWWGSVFLVNVPVVLVALAAIWWVVPESRDPSPQRVDPLGVVLSITGLVLLVYGIIALGEGGAGSARVLLPVVGGAAVLVLFGALQRRSDAPMLDLTLFRNPAFAAACGAVALVMFALFGTVFFLAFYLQYARGYTPLQAGLCLLPVALSISWFAPRSPQKVARYGARTVCAAGLLLVTASFAGYHLVDASTSIWVVEALLFLEGVGMAHVIAPSTESMMSTLPRHRAGAGSAVNATVRQVSGALGVAVLGSVLSASYRSHVAPALAGLPAPVRTAAGESVGGTVLVAQRLAEPQRGELVAAAQSAFVAAMHLTALGSAGVALVGALVVARWLPGRPAAALRGTPAPVRVGASA